MGLWKAPAPLPRVEMACVKGRRNATMATPFQMMAATPSAKWKVDTSASQKRWRAKTPAPCGDTQCTTVFARQSRCLDTIATKSDGVSTEKKAEPKRVGAQSQQEEQNVPDMVSFLEIMEGAKAGGEGAFMRGASGFCECSVQFCQQTSGGADPLDFTCKSTSKGWARTSVADSTCTCGTGFCSMPLTGNDVGTSHYTPLHANMIRNNATGVCQCRAQTAAVNSSDPLLATLAQEAACKINPVEPVVKVSGGS